MSIFLLLFCLQLNAASDPDGWSRQCLITIAAYDQLISEAKQLGENTVVEDLEGRIATINGILEIEREKRRDRNDS